MKPFVYVALDYDGQQKNFAFARTLAEAVSSDRYGFKVNLDSAANFAADAQSPYHFMKQVLSLGKPVFLDMKMWNGGRTMTNIARGCADLGVDIINMYPHAGGKFISQVAAALEGSKTKLFGLTVLTHYTDDDTQTLYGRSLADTVAMLAKMNHDHGAHGLIVPATQLSVVRNLPLLKLCPGIRPAWYEDTKDNFQEQTSTAEEAAAGGADYLVIGSPIRKSKSPAKALERILSE